MRGSATLAGQLLPPLAPYRITPRLHKSTACVYGCSCTSSGAMYSGVPLMLVSTSVWLLIARAKPKSHSFTRFRAPTRMFWGFMSRWMTRLECR